MANESFIEVTRKGGGKARLRADTITAFIEVDPKEPDKAKPVVQVHIGTNTFVTVQDEPLWALWNKYVQAVGGRNITCITSVSDEAPGHPNFGKPRRPAEAA